MTQGIWFVKGEKAGESVVLKYQTSIPTTCPVNRRKISPQPNGFLSIDTAGTARRIDYGGNWCFKVVTPTTLTGSTNDYAMGDGAFFRISSNTPISITGVAGGTEGRRATFINVDSNNIKFTNEDAASVAANRIILGAGVTTFIELTQNDSIELIYDPTTARWRRIGTIV